jgi:hypothetical protein
VKDGMIFRQPRALEDRHEIARVLVERLGYRMPVALDSMKDEANAAYAAWPERLYVVEKGGRVAFKGGMGPFGFHPEEAEAVLKRLLGR